jgi:hypothetical protein
MNRMSVDERGALLWMNMVPGRISGLSVRIGDSVGTCSRGAGNRSFVCACSSCCRSLDEFSRISGSGAGGCERT